jgi:cell wall-associated NlpC family hydrolase
MTKREYIIQYVRSFIGTRYIFYGDKPMNGFDCSGLVSEVARGIGFIGGKERYSAQGFHNLFNQRGLLRRDLELAKMGDVVLFGTGDDCISHIGIVSEISGYMYEAGGGGHETVTTEQAAMTDAFVRSRPIRKDLVAYVNISGE